ncbi:hypothetical protein ACFQ1S_25045 [Kibdelosporangium lantanae]|uniref:Uncharacterized protein n=1 Tax=Kibdelosporangium lantanae TaxID=1497396 RepID=A0ABW3ME38_9PSEU
MRIRRMFAAVTVLTVGYLYFTSYPPGPIPVLSLIAVPLLWTKYQPENPGLHDRDYPLGLAITLGVVWVVVLIVVGVRKILRSRTEQARG